MLIEGLGRRCHFFLFYQEDHFLLEVWAVLVPRHTLSYTTEHPSRITTTAAVLQPTTAHYCSFSVTLLYGAHIILCVSAGKSRAWKYKMAHVKNSHAVLPQLHVSRATPPRRDLPCWGVPSLLPRTGNLNSLEPNPQTVKNRNINIKLFSTILAFKKIKWLIHYLDFV